MLQYFRSDAVVVRFPAAGLCDPLSPEERNRPQETRHDQDEQLPVKQQVVTVEEGHSRHDGLYELEDGKGRSAVVFKQEADDAEELSVEAAVSEAEQETAEQRHADVGRYKGLQVCPGLTRHRSVFGDVQENQIKSQVVSDEAQQHHRVPPKPDILVQHPEHTSS